MNKRTDGKMPAAVERVQEKFATWREQKRGRARIPEHLWNEAVRAARQHGVNQVSSALSLDYSHLKRRLDKTARETKKSPKIAEAMFVEIPGVMPEQGPTCVVELEKENGTRMRICVRDSATVDWCRMKEAFLGA